MTTQHTPGPWQLNIDTVHIREGVNVQPVTHSMDSQGIADARLIAAAPDLLEALRRLADWVFRLEAKENICSSVWMDAREAIAKAEGRAE